MTLPIQRSLRDVLQWLGSQGQTEGKKKENRSKSDNKALSQLQDMVKDFSQSFIQEKKKKRSQHKKKGFVEFISTSNFVRLTSLTDHFRNKT